ncbi:MAG: RNA polymerase subunit sigma-24 [Chryseobacterium sp. SCN 40-13]|nr:MAG: RNA polymerase subunit sigma-24 [Chryseobacterium sp. SCN 40-13]
MSHLLEHHFIEAKKQNRNAQKALYEMFSGKMLSIALSYTGNLHDAEDVLQNAFYKGFTKINDCKDWKTFPGWLRRIVINESISFLRQNQKIVYSDISEIAEEPEIESDFADISLEEIFTQMPTGYKVVFNLFVFEDKKHQEIAELLSITQGTSKSQLNKAKRWISEYLKTQCYEQ